MKKKVHDGPPPRRFRCRSCGTEQIRGHASRRCKATIRVQFRIDSTLRNHDIRCYGTLRLLEDRTGLPRMLSQIALTKFVKKPTKFDIIEPDNPIAGSVARRNQMVDYRVVNVEDITDKGYSVGRLIKEIKKLNPGKAIEVPKKSANGLLSQLRSVFGPRLNVVEGNDNLIIEPLTKKRTYLTKRSGRRKRKSHIHLMKKIKRLFKAGGGEFDLPKREFGYKNVTSRAHNYAVNARQRSKLPVWISVPRYGSIKVTVKPTFPKKD